MSKRESFSRYIFIIKKLRRGPASFNEISDYLKRESELQDSNFNTTIRTFQRDMGEINHHFNIEIKCDRSSNIYYINCDEQPVMNERILEAFDTFNALNIADRLSKNMYFENRKPLGTENLHGILHAINNNVQIIFSYHKFWEEEITKRTVEPYALKEFKNRWYILAKDLKDNNVKSFALDRLTNLEITNRKFKQKEKYNIEESFKYSFGIISPNNVEPKDIILAFDPIQGKYIKTLSLHESQQILIDNEEELQIKLKLYITHDLIMELLSYGNSMKVIKPKSLALEIKKEHEKAFKQYVETNRTENKLKLKK